jgi:hypothetical protein
LITHRHALRFRHRGRRCQLGEIAGRTSSRDASFPPYFRGEIRSRRAGEDHTDLRHPPDNDSTIGHHRVLRVVERRAFRNQNDEMRPDRLGRNGGLRARIGNRSQSEP